MNNWKYLIKLINDFLLKNIKDQELLKFYLKQIK